MAKFLLLMLLSSFSQLIVADPIHPGAELKRQALTNPTLAVGVWDVTTAKHAYNHGYVTFLSGNGVVAAIGKNDTGAYSAQHALEWTRNIRKALPEIVLLVDVDGLFNLPPADAVELVNELEQLGAAGIVYDDQEPQNRKAGMKKGKTQISLERNLEVLTAVVKGKINPNTLIFARTSNENKQEAFDIALKYDRAGADVVIAESLNDEPRLLSRLASELNNALTSVIHIPEGVGIEALWSPEVYQASSVGVIIAPTILTEAANQAMQNALLLGIMSCDNYLTRSNVATSSY